MEHLWSIILYQISNIDFDAHPMSKNIYEIQTKLTKDLSLSSKPNLKSPPYVLYWVDVNVGEPIFTLYLMRAVSEEFESHKKFEDEILSTITITRDGNVGKENMEPAPIVGMMEEDTKNVYRVLAFLDHLPLSIIRADTVESV